MFHFASKPYTAIEDLLQIENSTYYRKLVNTNPVDAVNELFESITDEDKTELASKLNPPCYSAIRKYLENIGVYQMHIDSFICELLKQKRKYLNIINH